MQILSNALSKLASNSLSFCSSELTQMRTTSYGSIKPPLRSISDATSGSTYFRLPTVRDHILSTSTSTRDFYGVVDQLPRVSILWSVAAKIESREHVNLLWFQVFLFRKFFKTGRQRFFGDGRNSLSLRGL